jgi:acetyl esterase/lipase
MKTFTFTKSGRVLLLTAAAMVMTGFASNVSAQGDTAYVPFVVNVNATVKAVPKAGTTAVVDSVKKTVTANQQTNLAIPLPATSGVLNGAQSRLSVPAVINNHAGKVTVNLSAQFYSNAEISLYTVNGKRIMRSVATAAEVARTISRGNLVAGAYLLSIKGTDGNTVASRLTHNGGSLNISVAFDAENISNIPQLAKQAANGEWTITVKAAASDYSDSTYTLVPTKGTHATQNITLRTATTPPITQRSWTNVDYAPTASRRHARQRYDIKLPSSGNGPFPLLIYVHGGGFSGGDWELSKNNNGLVSRANSNGYAVASVGYLLMGQSGWSGGQRAFPENVEDVLAAVRHLRANAATYHIDPDKFAVSGFSAGAYMTAIVCALSNATNHGYDITSLGNAGVSHAVQAAASSAALTDFSLLNTHQNQNTGITYFLDHDATPEGALLGGNLKNDKDKEPMKTYLKMQNPLTHITAATPPIYMMHGTSDNLVPWQQSDIMVNKVNSFVANKAKFNKVSGRSHADFDGASDSKTIEILNFLDNALGIQR